MAFPRRFIFSSLATLLLLGSLLLLFLTLLTGGTETSILKKFWWLQTDCSGFGDSKFDGDCRWTSYGLCSVSNGNNVDCTSASAAFPLDPFRNFGSSKGLPSDFQRNNDYYYYMSRIGWGFQLVAIAFLAFSLIPFFILLIKGNSLFLTIFLSLLGASLLFLIPGMSLTTAAYVRGRNVFSNAGLSSKIGTKPFATGWSSIATIILLGLISIFILKNLGKQNNYSKDNYQQDNYTDDTYVAKEEKQPKSNWFSRKFVVNNSQNNGYPTTYSANTAPILTTPVAPVTVVE